MAALTTLFPVFFMLALGMISRIRGWISEEQKAGAYSIIIKILFPIMVFNLMMSASFEASHLSIVAYVVICYALILLIGKWISPVTGKKFAHISNYLLITNEGGNVALPLYLSIVGASSNTLIFDLAGSFMCFIVLPILLARKSAGNASFKELLKAIFTNSFILAVLFGLILNFTGFYTWLQNSIFFELYSGTISMATGPIIGVILFSLGYDLKIEKETLGPILKLVAARVIIYAAVIAGFFVFFPHLMADPVFKIAVFIYFSCPTGFGLPPVISSAFRSREDEEFASSYLSIFMIVTLIVYTAVVIFYA